MPATARGEIFLFSFFFSSHSQHVKERFLFLWGWRGRYPIQPEDLCPDRSFPAWVGAMRLLFGYYEWMKVNHPCPGSRHFEIARLHCLVVAFRCVT